MIDTTALFVHVLAAIGLVGGGIVQVLAGRRLRAAGTAPEIASWATFTRSAGLLIAVSAFLSLLTGGHLAAAVWTTESSSGFSNPFITLGALALVVLAPAGPMIGGAQLRRLAADARSTGQQPGGDLADLRARASSSALWGPVHSLVGVGVGLVAVMVYKPGWVATAVTLLLTFALGWAAGVVVARRQAAAAPATA